jgi:hypothetical protein
VTRPTNQGIQGTNLTITAEALAVGDRATATSNTFSRNEQRDLTKAVERLEAAIGALSLEPATRDAVKDDVSRLSELAQAPQSRRDEARASLDSIVAKLSAAGVVVSQIASLMEPVRQIAATIGLAIHAIG